MRLNPGHSFHKIIQRCMQYLKWLIAQISPDGTFPLIGRSIVYKTAIYHSVVSLILYYSRTSGVLEIKIPMDSRSNYSLGEILTLMFRTVEKCFTPAAFNSKGFLNLGIVSYQPELANSYSNSGSVYFSAVVFGILSLRSEYFNSIQSVNQTNNRHYNSWSGDLAYRW